MIFLLFLGIKGRSLKNLFFLGREQLASNIHLISRSKICEKAVINLPDANAKCYLWIDKNKLATILIADDQYPQRVAFSILRQMNEEYYKKFGKQDLQQKGDCDLKLQVLDKMITKYQDPKQADKLQKLKCTLKEVQQICHKNLDDLMRRDQNLQKLMQKSKDISNMSLDFYKSAKKANTRCCSLY